MTYRYLGLLILLNIAFMQSKPPVVTGNRQPIGMYVKGDWFRSIANHVYDETDISLNPTEVAYADIVFVKGDKMEAFFSNIHPHIQCRYILIVHNSDADCPGQFESYLQDDKIIKWFGQNPTVMHHEKFIPIPIGVANWYVHNHGNYVNFDHFWLKKHDKKYLLGYNFYEGTYVLERRPLLRMLASCGYAQALFAGKHIDYLTKMSQTQFIVSPRGNGLDCHRTWEAFIVGTVPIVTSSCLDELLEELPVLIINDWSEISKDMLQKKYAELRNRFNRKRLQKVTWTYWQHKVLNCQQQAKAQGAL